MKKVKEEKLPVWKKEDYDLINTDTKRIVLSYPKSLDTILNILKRFPGSISLIERILQIFEEEARILLKEVAPMIEEHQNKKPSLNDTLVKITKWQMEGTKLLAEWDSANRVLALGQTVRDAISDKDAERAAIDMMRLSFATVTANLYEIVLRGIRAKAGPRKRRMERKKSWVLPVIQYAMTKAKKKSCAGVIKFLVTYHEGKKKALKMGRGKVYLFLTRNGDYKLRYESRRKREEITSETFRREYFEPLKKLGT